MGAVIRNYTRVEDLKRSWEDGLWQLTLRSTNQDKSVQGQSVNLTADIVLNLAGAWVDEVSNMAGSNSAAKCCGIKGIHIALRLPEEFADWGLFTYNSIGEPIYCIPFRGIHYIGLTRTPFDGDPTGIHATDQEIDWMLAETNRCLPKLAVTRNDVLFSWAGVNPLTSDPAEPLGSRENKIHDLANDGLPGILTLTGGPIMTHRSVAKDLLAQVQDRLLPSRAPQDVQHVTIDDTGYSNAEIERCAREEMPITLADLLMRRLGLGWEPDQGLGLAQEVANAAAPHMGWSEDQIKDELNSYEAHLLAARRRPE